MQPGHSHVKPPAQALISALLVALVLLLDAMVACPGLHEMVHSDADHAGHECAVTMFIHGQVDSAAVLVVAVLPPPPVVFSPLPAIVQFHTRTDALPPGRGPPASFFLA